MPSKKEWLRAYDQIMAHPLAPQKTSFGAICYAEGRLLEAEAFLALARRRFKEARTGMKEAQIVTAKMLAEYWPEYDPMHKERCAQVVCEQSDMFLDGFIVGLED